MMIHQKNTLLFDFIKFIATKYRKNNNKYKSQSIQEISKCIDDNDLCDVIKTVGLSMYTKDDFLNEVYITEEKYNDIVGLLKHRKNIILQGAPGVGKTFAAKRLAYSMMGEKDDNRIEVIQFHQSYSYEDFIRGYKPNENGFSLKNGVFYKFCKTANDNPEKEYFFIIDEINRGNLSKIFGELLMLIENDYRGTEVKLAYGQDTFAVPKNLYIIGLMNTADRSLALIDYALRRRFSFVELKPAFASPNFKEYLDKLTQGDQDHVLKKVIEEIQELNSEIEKDESFGKGFCIGHSYFCEQKTFDKDWIKRVIKYDIIPTLEEYWFDNPEKLKERSQKLMDILGVLS